MELTFGTSNLSILFNLYFRPILYQTLTWGALVALLSNEVWFTVADSGVTAGLSGGADVVTAAACEEVVS